MIRKAAQMETEVRNIRNGIGNVTVQHLFKKEEITARTRMCSRLTLPPGVSIGMHKHEGEDELFIVTRGKGLIDDGQSREPVQAGDAILTGKGEAHAVINNGREPLEMIAIIMLYS
ncbi:MAG: cupin domain-containing protein [Kiritimatiellota bacterium]|nr:cupin domain-containing protein [Kiritimatiellota bacterium]